MSTPDNFKVPENLVFFEVPKKSYETEEETLREKLEKIVKIERLLSQLPEETSKKIRDEEIRNNSNPDLDILELKLKALVNIKEMIPKFGIGDKS